MPWTNDPCAGCSGTGDVRCEYGLTTCPTCLGSGRRYEPETVRLDPPHEGYIPGRPCSPSCPLCSPKEPADARE